MKSVLVKHLYTAYQTTSAHVRTFLEIKEDMEELKSYLIRSQSTVIKLQAELLEIKSNQLESVHSTVKTAVQNTVQAVSTTAPVLTEESLKKVVQNAVSEEDRSRNVLIFGLKETDEEKLCDKVDVIFQQIEEKPRFEAIRVGRKSADKTRPVKVSLGNFSTVHQILVNAKKLRLCEDHKTVFISPDRSPEDRAIHQQLVLEMKQIAKEDIKKHYYIRSGNICSDDKIFRE